VTPDALKDARVPIVWQMLDADSSSFATPSARSSERSSFRTASGRHCAWSQLHVSPRVVYLISGSWFYSGPSRNCRHSRPINQSFDAAQYLTNLVTRTEFWLGNLREGDHLGGTGGDGRIIVRWVFRKWDVGAWTRSSWLRIGTGGGFL
jgi:hypothetical protein